MKKPAKMTDAAFAVLEDWAHPDTRILHIWHVGIAPFTYHVITAWVIT